MTSATVVLTMRMLEMQGIDCLGKFPLQYPQKLDMLQLLKRVWFEENHIVTVELFEGDLYVSATTGYEVYTWEPSAETWMV